MVEAFYIAAQYLATVAIPNNEIKLLDDLEIKPGKHYNEGWKGIVPPVSVLTLDEAIRFYQERIVYYK